MSEIKFSDGMPVRPVICGTNKSQAELSGKKCGGCVRCETKEQVGGSGWHCTMQAYDKDIDPSDAACMEYWSKTEQRVLNCLRDQSTMDMGLSHNVLYAEKCRIAVSNAIGAARDSSRTMKRRNTIGQRQRR